MVRQACLSLYRLKPLTSVNSPVVDDMAVYVSMTESPLFPRHLFWLTTPFLAQEDFSVDPTNTEMHGHPVSSLPPELIKISHNILTLVHCY